jgi:hypothetical protein
VANHARDVRPAQENLFFLPSFTRDGFRLIASLHIDPIAIGDVLLYRLPIYGSVVHGSYGIGRGVSVSSVVQKGKTMTVNGSGFSVLSVINFYNKQAGRVVNLGGLKWGGFPMIPTLSVTENTLTFAIPEGAGPGPCYVEILNPPYTSRTSSRGFGGSCFLR